MKHSENYTFKGAHHFCGVTYPDGNRKQDRMLSLALSPEHSCPKDAPCRRENGGTCYYQAEGAYHPSVAKSASNNWSVYKTDPDRFWKSFEKALEYCKKEGVGFRPFEGGDIPDYGFFCKLMQYAEKYPHKMHGMTKQYALVNRYIAEHGGNKSCVLHFYNLRFSRWDGYPMENPYGMPEFARVFEEEKTTCLEQRMKMVGKEWSCMDCYFRGTGCYRADNATIYCIDHAVEARIVRSRGLWKK